MKRLILLMIAMFVGLVAMIVVPVGIRQMNIARAVSEVAASGDPAGLADLQANHVWDHRNAAWHLDAVDQDAQKLFSAISPALYLDESFDWRNELPDAAHRQLATDFATYPNVFDAVDSAIRCKHYSNFAKLETSITAFQQQMYDRIGMIRTVQRILVARCQFLAAIGEYEQAARLAIDSLNLVRLQEQDPTIIQFMTAAACRTPILEFLAELVAFDSLDPNLLGLIDAELRRHDAMDSCVHALKTERALGIELNLRGPLGMPLSGQMLQPYLDYMRDEIARGAISRFEETAPLVTAKAAEVAVVAPAMDAGRALMNRQRAKIHCLRLLIALHRQALTNESALSPLSQSDATQVADFISEWGLPANEFNDPYTGKPPIARQSGDSWLVYCVGENKVDNNGQFEDDHDVGFGPLPRAP
ncbi:hypothetical protein [Aporhodopirellula aestuarii]|uniref:Type II secretion system protein GspG C-terminal domain-containing protein n=1 Tax=Aporhodopirellula aestuarii TaxID=2950107 RepID=A0ABT0U9A5_9BACT|nr:hypothetical protein [Aporhodopirellula aestuarii]MCM2373490.1 hypothetical protein [Aporhodopirellula aestuarii]